jgi:hypothetical protein
MRESSTVAIGDVENDADRTAPGAAFDPKALLAALAVVLRDTIDRFSEVSGRVTENVLTRGNPADHSLIVALQDFDRLQQEFDALNGVLSNCAGLWDGSEESDGEQASFGCEAITGIGIADLKDRLLSRLHNEAIYLATHPACKDDEVF